MSEEYDYSVKAQREAWEQKKRQRMLLKERLDKIIRLVATKQEYVVSKETSAWGDSYYVRRKKFLSSSKILEFHPTARGQRRVDVLERTAEAFDLAEQIEKLLPELKPKKGKKTKVP